jgi:hypothetical protein
MSAISPVTEARPTYPESSETGATSAATVVGDPLAELAALLVENDFLRAEADEQAMRAAREAERRAMGREVAAMHDAADAIVAGAWAQGGAAVLGGGAQCYGAVMQVGSATATELEIGLQKGGQALSSVAVPAGQLFGDAPKARADADAAEARNAAERADARADEASAHRERVERHTHAVLDLVEGTLETEQHGNFAILGNF